VELEVYHLPSDLEQAVAGFIRYYNEARYHESLDNLTPPMFTLDGPNAS
jgi:putative transposase